MIDIETHQIVDLIDSREINDVVAWLKTYPNLKVISRDGSVSYNSAIKQVNTNIVQVSDRFHLIKGLTDAAKKYITKLVSANFGIPITASHYEGLETGYWNKEIVDDFPTREHEQTVVKKMEIVKKVRELKKKGFTNVKIASDLGISNITVAKYIKSDYSLVNGLYNTTYPSKIKPYAKNINTMITEGYTFKMIEKDIREKGYDGAASTIRMYATRERKLMKEAQKSQGEAVEKIERKWVISLLYKPVDKVKGITQLQIDRVIEKYPIIGRIYDIIREFKETLFSKKPGILEKWMEEALLLGIDEIDSFVGGIKRDIEAVRNSIELEYNNGLAEGSVNKLKVIKRIMYGRNSFQLLKSKLLRLEFKRKIN